MFLLGFVDPALVFISVAFLFLLGVVDSTRLCSRFSSPFDNVKRNSARGLPTAKCMLTLSLTSATLARPRPEIKLPAVAGRAPPTRLRISQADEDGDDGAALFRPYSPAEETVTVPESSRRLFVTLLTVPTLALLAGIITYNPTADDGTRAAGRAVMARVPFVRDCLGALAASPPA